MMDNRIPYDKAATIWSPDGELVQLSYARRATERGLPGVALILNDKEILLAAKIKIDSLIEAPSKVKSVDENMYMLASGLSSDSNLLLVQARYMAQNHKLVYGERISPYGLTKKIGSLLSEVTMQGGLRVFGASLIMAGFTPYEKKPEVYFLDNGGSFFSAKAYATGQDQDKIISYFREHYNSPISEDGAKRLVLDAINASVSDPTKKIEEKDLEFMKISAN
ncbi:MAG: Proteasome subunit alpha [Candidatus Heimdallarchaeota archaeon LC_3]|nr:MAG: Proteasome subunit alpha [Candidatus Heimdallarchaeota archaeon LC_3]